MLISLGYLQPKPRRWIHNIESCSRQRIMRWRMVGSDHSKTKSFAHVVKTAGIPMQDIYGSRTGVYTGSMAADYQHIITKDLDHMPKYTATGTAGSMIANRLSWYFNLTGPSVNMDSACSSSLTALNFAVQGLRNKDSDMVCFRPPRDARS